MSKKLLKVLAITATFWILDVLAHNAGVGETNYYYISKLANSIIFAILWCFVFSYKEHWKKLLFSFVFGTWISFYYLVSSYSGLVQWLGLYARYTPPPFEFFGLVFSPFWWWVFHALTFYAGLELSGLIKENKR